MALSHVWYRLSGGHFQAEEKARKNWLTQVTWRMAIKMEMVVVDDIFPETQLKRYRYCFSVFRTDTSYITTCSRLNTTHS